jgi:hypothetical protein
VSATRKTPFVSVNITGPARDELRAATLALTTSAERRVSMSDVLIAAIRVALKHRDEVVSELRGKS